MEERYIFNPKIENNGIKLRGEALNGGKISKEDIDFIKQHPEISKIEISGLYQDTLEYFVFNYGQQFNKILFWKCPKIEDLSPLENLQKIERIDFFWNQKAEKLWDLSKNKNLLRLSLNDFNRISNLEPLSKSETLEVLEFGFYVHPKFELKSLEPLTRIKSLKELSFNAKKVPPNDYKWLVKIPNLKKLNIPIGMFKTSEIAWIKAHLNKEAKKNFYGATVKSNPIENEKRNKTLDTFIVGKRKPWLDSKLDKVRIEKYTIKFNEMVKWFENNPEKTPNDFK